MTETAVRRVIVPCPQAHDWQPLGAEAVLAKKFGLQLISRKFRRPDGEEDEFVFCRKTPGVTILPITTDGNLVLVGQFKQGLGKFVYEAPAGTVQDGDDFVQLALSELAGETGYRAEDIQPLCDSPSCPGPRKFDTAEMLYVATGASLVGQQKTDDDEWIEVIEVSPDVFREMCNAGEIVSAGTREAFGWAIAGGFIPFSAL